MENNQKPRDPIAEFRSRINLYSYICQVAFVFFDLLVGGVSLIVAHDADQALGFLWAAFGCSIFSLILVAILSALYFVGDDEERNSLSRIRASLWIRMSLRILGVITMCMFFIHLGVIVKTATNWTNFLNVYAVVGVVISGLATMYAIWKLAWMKENPERYQAVYASLHSRRDVTKKEKNEKDFTSKKTPVKKETPKNEIIEVDATEKKK
jgi:cytochrome bd-type quinol oxidase subunit 2